MSGDRLSAAQRRHLGVVLDGHVTVDLETVELLIALLENAHRWHPQPGLDGHTVELIAELRAALSAGSGQ